MSRKGKRNKKWESQDNFFPKVVILMAAYNEEEGIENNIRSLLETKYPLDKLEIWIGSDCSTDKTDEILTHYAKLYPIIHFIRFNERTGKPQIINHLQTLIQSDILILSDADTIFNPDTILELIKPFQNPNIGGVQANYKSLASKIDVGLQEVKYNNREIEIKKGESLKGSVIGAYGACYALRNNLYVPVPKGFICDDFFIFLNVINQGFQTVFNEKSYCDVQISEDSQVQFRRKVRIGTGNYQNFFYFKNFQNPFKSFANFAYFSHKVLRWFTPFLLILVLLTNIALAIINPLIIFDLPIYPIVLNLQIIFYLIPILDFMFNKIKINFKIFRFVSHFIKMNIALLLGFRNYIKGNNRSSWDNKVKEY